MGEWILVDDNVFKLAQNNLAGRRVDVCEGRCLIPLALGHAGVVDVEAIDELARLVVLQVQLDIFHSVKSVHFLFKFSEQLESSLPSSNAASNATNDHANNHSNRSCPRPCKKANSGTRRCPGQSADDSDSAQLCPSLEFLLRDLTFLVLPIVDACLRRVN